MDVRCIYSALFGDSHAGLAGREGCDIEDALLPALLIAWLVLPAALTPLKLADLDDEVDEMEATLMASSLALLLLLP